MPKRDSTAHKGTFGTVVCVAGSLDYAGAAYMTALAAARGGSGLVAIAVPESLRPVFAGRLPEAILLGLPETRGGAIDHERSIDEITSLEAGALVVGPGLKESDDYRALIIGLVSMMGAPAVVDAGALNMLSRSGEWWRDSGRNLVLTPHPREFARLTGSPVGPSDRERMDRCLEATQRFDQVVVLKGAYTVIGEPSRRVAISPFANSALATAGSGDVLAGLIGALLAQGVEPFGAACLGVYLHAMAGERLSARLGDGGLLASELPYEIAVARHELATKRVD
ncbi:MAG: NAD(P)H-hydrate dehydratase [Candidatus Limnocylindrales bacterium]